MLQISFASVSVPIYNSEMAPPQHRGSLNQLYQLTLTFFIFVAQLINFIVSGEACFGQSSWSASKPTACMFCMQCAFACTTLCEPECILALHMCMTTSSIVITMQ